MTGLEIGVVGVLSVLLRQLLESLKDDDQRRTRQEETCDASSNGRWKSISRTKLPFDDATTDPACCDASISLNFGESFGKHGLDSCPTQIVALMHPKWENSI